MVYYEIKRELTMQTISREFTKRARTDFTLIVRIMTAASCAIILGAASIAGLTGIVAAAPICLVLHRRLRNEERAYMRSFAAQTNDVANDDDGDVFANLNKQAA
jgi:hypothetical protein